MLLDMLHIAAPIPFEYQKTRRCLTVGVMHLAPKPCLAVSGNKNAQQTYCIGGV